MERAARLYNPGKTSKRKGKPTMQTVTIYERTILARTGYKAYPFKEETQVSIFVGKYENKNHSQKVGNPLLKIPFKQVLKTRSPNELVAYMKSLGRKQSDAYQKSIIEIILTGEKSAEKYLNK